VISFKEYIDVEEQLFDQFLDEMTDEEIVEFCNSIDEALPRIYSNKFKGGNPRVQRIDRSTKRKRSILYRRHRQMIKRQQTKYRRTSKYKQYKRRQKLFFRRGRTTTGKYIRKKKVI